MKQIKVCYILSYYDPSYIRTRSILNQLELIKKVQLYKAINTNKNFLRYFETLWKLLIIRFKYNPSIYILGFRGHELFLPVRLITLGKTLIFDEFNSPYLSFTEEKKDIRKNDLTARIISYFLKIKVLKQFLFKLGYYYERYILRKSDHVLTDTISHQKRFSKIFNIPNDKFTTLHVGTDENIFYPRQIKIPKVYQQNKFNVFFYGNLIPLHGINIILEAAKIINNTENSIQFTIVGGKGKKKQIENIENYINKYKLTNITYLKWLDFETELPIYMNQADLCLGGPFGISKQANHVITGKTYQFMSIGKPTIIGRNIETENLNLLKHKKSALIIEKGNSSTLANTILWSFKNQDSLKEIAINGQNVYKKRFSTKVLSNVIQNIINKYE